MTRGDLIAYSVKGVAHDAVFSDMTITNADILTQAKAYKFVKGYGDGSINVVFVDQNKVNPWAR